MTRRSNHHALAIALGDRIRQARETRQKRNSVAPVDRGGNGGRSSMLRNDDDELSLELVAEKMTNVPTMMRVQNHHFL